MTNTIDRRKLLTTAVLGGAGIVGATALGSLAPEAAFAADEVDAEPGPSTRISPRAESPVSAAARCS